MRTLVLGILLIGVAAGCAHRDANVNGGELIASEGVQQYFANNPDVDTLETSGDGGDDSIRCIRERRVGSHRVTRVCRTRQEWRDLAERSNRIVRDDMEFRRTNTSAQNGRGTQ